MYWHSDLSLHISHTCQTSTSLCDIFATERNGDQFRLLAGSPKPEPNVEALSDKEEKILQLITDGLSNRQIAAAMFLAEGTVKNYVSRIMEKLHANTRTALAVISAKQRRPG